MTPTIKHEIESTLLSLKEDALAATQRSDGNFYRDYLADNAIAISPHGILSKDAIVQQMGSGRSSFKSSKIEDTRAIVLTEETGIVTYKATFGSQPPVFVTTVYAKVDGVWKGVIYQQTPLNQK